MNKKILATVSLIALGLLLAIPTLILADVTGAGAPSGSGAASGGDACTTILAIQGAFQKVGAAIVIIGWIITGILYLTAAGSPEKIGTAKKALIACVIGTALIIISTTAFDFINGTLSLGGAGFSWCGAGS